MFSFIVRQPYAVLGAIGLLSVLKSFLTFHEDIAAIINAYQFITRGLWQFLFGGLYYYFPINIPGYLKDYFSMGVIIFFALLRTMLGAEDLIYLNLKTEIVSILRASSVWPIYLLNIVIRLVRDEKSRKDYGLKVFFEFVLWAIAIICLSYGMFFTDSIK